MKSFCKIFRDLDTLLRNASLAKTLEVVMYRMSKSADTDADEDNDLKNFADEDVNMDMRNHYLRMLMLVLLAKSWRIRMRIILCALKKMHYSVKKGDFQSHNPTHVLPECETQTLEVMHATNHFPQLPPFGKLQN